MRVYNLTDVSTVALQARGLVGVTIRVGGCDVPPGGFWDVAKLTADERVYLLSGALCVGEPPAWYRARKPPPSEEFFVLKASEEESSPPPGPEMRIEVENEEPESDEHTSETLIPGDESPTRKRVKRGR